MMRRYGQSLKQRQQGVALITVLVVFSIALVIVLSAGMRDCLDLRKASAQLETMNANQFALGAEELARQVLYEDLEKDEEKVEKGEREVEALDTLDEIWALKAPPLATDEGHVEIKIIDAYSKFNLNSLADAPERQGQVTAPQEGTDFRLSRSRFIRMLEVLKVEELGDATIKELSDAIFDWVDGDDQSRTFDTEDDGYLGLEDPYRTNNFRFGSIEELLLVRGMNPQIYARLKPYITLLPVQTFNVNLNTIEPVLFASLFDSAMTLELAEEVLRQRGKEGWEEQGAFVTDFCDNNTYNEEARRPVARARAGGGQGSGDAVECREVGDFVSEYFEVWAKAQYGDRNVTLISLLRRNRDEKRLQLLSRDRSRRFDINQLNQEQLEEQQEDLNKLQSEFGGLNP